MSSYEKNRYDEVFAAYIDAFAPVEVVELGVLDGFSLLAMGRALKKLGRGRITAYDLWDAYPYKHGNKDAVQKEIERNSLTDYITLCQGDGLDPAISNSFDDRSIGLLHVDISNCGRVVRETMRIWDPKIVQGGLVIFEGGTIERDNIEWMKKYNREPMKVELETNNIIEERYVFATYLPFPGLTVLLKKR